MKRIISMLLMAAMLFSLSATAFAVEGESNFTDVSADAWYAEAVNYVRANDIMNGTSTTTFAPDASMTRAMLAAVLYRAAGSPAVTGTDDFTDTADGAWYSNAVLWASQQKLVGGYGNGLFGTNDPVTREQVTAILWRYRNQPAQDGTAAAFSDEAQIAAYALPAVKWARSAGIVNTRGENQFAPKESATRAEVAFMLWKLLDTTPAPAGDGKALVVYFSMPETTNPNNMSAEEEYSTVVINGEVLGNTQYVAYLIQQAMSGDIFRIEPVTPYPMNHAELEEVATAEKAQSARPEIAAQVEDMAQYDTIFIGYPIWYADMPMIVYSFLEQYDLSGKTIVPFITSGASGFSGSIQTIQRLQPNATVVENGYSITRNRMEEAPAGVTAWLTELGYTK